MRSLILSSSLFLLLLCSWSCGSPSCLDEHGSEVEWFVALKLPHLPPHSDGHSYVFLTSKSVERKPEVEISFEQSQHSVQSNQSIMGRTLSVLYSGNDSINHVLYNDEHPNGNTTFLLGHTKGVIVLDRLAGFVLIHSVPKFPVVSEASVYTFPMTGLKYGQSFLCMSINADRASMDTLALHLLYNTPFYYSRHLNSAFVGEHPKFARVTQGHLRVRKAPYYHVGVMRSRESTLSFRLMSKSSHFNKDLYKTLVSSVLDSDLLVESWPNGRGRLESDCKGVHAVRNVDEIRLANLNFSSHHDHSKWALAQHHVCIGDINRMDTQFRRAGGTICFLNHQVKSAFSKAIAHVQSCSKASTAVATPLIALTRVSKSHRNNTIRLWYLLVKRATQSPSINQSH